MQLPQRDVQGPLVLIQGAQTIIAQVHTFPNTDTSGPDEQQSVGQKVIPAPEPSIQESIVLRGKWPGQILVATREVLTENQAVDLKSCQQAPETKYVTQAGDVRQRMFFLTHPTQPAEDVWITVELGEPVDTRVGGLEVVQETVDGPIILPDSQRSDADGHSSNRSLEDLFQR